MQRFPNSLDSKIVNTANYPYCPWYMSALWGDDESGLEISPLKELHQITNFIVSFKPEGEKSMLDPADNSRTLLFPTPYVYRYNPRNKSCKTVISMANANGKVSEKSDGLSFDTPNVTQVNLLFAFC
jgi:hypothetical protein